PGVLEALSEADVVLLGPSNPIVSIGTILAVPGVQDAVRTTTARVVGVSPIIGGSAVRGVADELLEGLGVEVSASAVARRYGARTGGGVLDGWLVDTRDAGECHPVEEAGIRCRAVPLLMRDAVSTRTLAADTLQLAADLAPGTDPAR